MGNSTAYPILRTGDLAEAHDLARQLLAIAEPLPGARMTLDFPATVSEHDTLKRMLTGLTGLNVLDTRGLEPRGHQSEWPQQVPLNVELSDADPILADAVISCMGQSMGSMDWSNFLWPTNPHMDWPVAWKYTGLQIAFHSSKVFWDEPDSDHSRHTVFVHTRGDEYAAWLASRVGTHVIGPGQLGF